MKIRKIFFSLIIFSFFTSLSAQDFPRPHPGPHPLPRKRMHSSEDFENQKFILFGVRTSRIKEDFIIIDFKFNKPIIPQTIRPDSVLIDGIPFFIDSLRFSKDGRSFRIAIKNPPEKFSLLIQGIKSVHGEILPPILLEDAEAESIFNFRRREWQKY